VSEWDEGEEFASKKELREKECKMYKGVGRGGVEVDVYRGILCRQRVVPGEADLEIFKRLP
jgi:hypothetical protein